MNIGKIIGIAHSNHIILRSIEGAFDKKLPDIGEKVYSSEKQKIGIITDIFGPVNKPFVSVKPFHSDAEIFKKYNIKKGSALFTLSSAQKSRRTKIKKAKFHSKSNPKNPKLRLTANPKGNPKAFKNKNPKPKSFNSKSYKSDLQKS
ncbi:MAG: Gar1/Naf1 family protein [Candidatus Lokiarchaeota archaeon]|nr:Gar1/Naf1 family protein [Candidatus Harpocratesius repetitus]